MPQYAHTGTHPVTVEHVDTTNHDIFPDGKVHPGQIIDTKENPDPANFTQVFPQEQPEAEPEETPRRATRTTKSNK